MPDSLLPQAQPGLLDLPQLNAAAPPRRPPARPQDMREFGDSAATRKNIYDGVFDAASNLAPVEDDRHVLKLSNLQWADPERFTRRRRKEAMLTGETLGRRLRGTWELSDRATGTPIDSRDQVVARVPYMTSMGTFINKGNDYTLNHQQRLLPGVYTRIKENGELEAHANVMPGKGTSHRYHLDPAKSVFKMRLGQADMPLMPLLRAMGTTDKQFIDAWGPEIYSANYKADDSTVLRKLKARLLSKADQADEDESSWRKKLVGAFEKMEVDPEVTRRTLGRPYARLDRDTILATTKKLLAVSRGEAEVDDRDNLANQSFHGPEDLFRERIVRDHGHRRRMAFKDASRLGNLSKMPSGLFTPQLDQAILGSGLGQALEEINPAEVFDKQSRITRMGEGGIPSLDAIPDEARGVQPSHLGFMDPVRTPESFRVGIDVQLARGARKGRDNKIYASLRDNRTGEEVWKSPQDLSDSSIATSDVLKWDTKRVPVMRSGKIDYVPKGEIDYVLPHFEDAFSPLANLVPLKSGIKPGRLAMGARYITQALPLSAPQAPLVQGAIPTDPSRSFEDEYGKHMGAVRAKGPGRVMSVGDGVVRVKYDDGTADDVELYENHPFNRKTYLHQTPTVKPGDVVGKDQLLAKSNYTDDVGAVALGANFRVAYVPWRGLNFKDAIAISETAAKRSASEHMYQHDLEVTDKHKMGKKNYASFFPQTFERPQLDRLDDEGVIRAGETVEFGQPLILAAREKDRALNKIHKKRQPGYADESVTWKHHDPGVVTDVVWGKSGPTVLVKSSSPTQVGDKMSGRYGDKGVVAAIIPDDDMPRGADGKPFEILLSPLGIISRTNPTQKLEAWLGKVAEKTGRPIKVPDFEDIDDLTDWTERQLKLHGLPDTEDLDDPAKGRKIRASATGSRYFMKLHHTAECFDDKTEALTHRGWVPWSEVAAADSLATVRDGRMVFERPLKLVQYHYSGELYCFTGRYIDYAVTPNHRLYVRGPQADSALTFKTAEELHGRRFCVPQFGMPHDADFTCEAGHDTPIWVTDGIEMAAGDYAELLGWWASEGYAKVTHRRACVVIYQSRSANPEHFARIEWLVRKLGLPWSYYRANGVDMGVHISSRPLATYLKQFGTHSHNKRLPRSLMRFGPDVLKRCYDAMMAGDGNVQETPTGPRARYVSTSKGLADDFQELCIRMGTGAVVRKCTPRKETHFLPAWECGVALSRTNAQVDGDRNKRGFIRRPYDGTVYCAEMATGLLYVRRNGKPMLSGNSKGQGRGSGGYTSEDAPSKGGESGCFTGGTTVSVIENGGREVRIAELVNGVHPEADVVTPTGFGAVTDGFRYAVHASELIEIELANGRLIDVTRNHRFYLSDGTEIPAGDLKPGDDLLE